MSGLVVVVTGGRDYSDFNAVWRALSGLGDVSMVVQGGCKGGADRHARSWASEQASVPCLNFPGQWSQGRQAGPARNFRMLETARRIAVEFGKDLRVLVFPGGPGTASCRRAAAAMGLQIVEGVG